MGVIWTYPNLPRQGWVWTGFKFSTRALPILEPKWVILSVWGSEINSKKMPVPSAI